MATLEDFFLKDYEEMRKKVKELEQRIEQMKPSKYGITDLGRSQELVKVSCMSEYYIKDVVKTSEHVNRLLAMSNNDLLNWAKTTRSGYYDAIIHIKRKTHPFTVKVEDLTSVKTYATDGCSEYILLGYMEEDMVDNLDAWCLPENEEALIDAAISYLRDELAKLADKYEKEEQAVEEQ